MLASLALVCTLTLSATAAERRHGLSAFGDLKYPADFTHFDYVNPNARKGGRMITMSTSGVLTFNSFNMLIVKSDAAYGLELLFDSLMVRAFDEPDAMYGLVAHSAEVADDRRSATFYLRPEAKFRDGTPVTADDVVFSFNTLRDPARAHPRFASALRDVVKAEAFGPHTVRYEFKGDNLRDLPRNVAIMPVLSKAYYTKVSFDKATLEPPLGSGPYEISDFKQGTFVTYKRRTDYWGRDLPVNRGRFNFDEIRYDYFRDRTAGMEAFKAGAYDLREEFTARVWATEYKMPQVDSGRIKLLTIPDLRPSGAQGFFINTRREKFADPRVRKALDYAFDFEWANKNLFYGLYQRTNSFFVNSDMVATGLPSEDELTLLAPFRDKLPPEVFGEPYSPPVRLGPGDDRRVHREAAKLLNEAGWTVNDQGVRVNAKGEPLTVELMMDEPAFERVMNFYVSKLTALGIQASVRTVDAAQSEERKKRFDFDMCVSRFAFEITPGPAFWNLFGSQAAKTSGSDNLAGIDNPAVDALIGEMLRAKSRPELVTAARALERVMRAGYYWVPQWYKPSYNIAFWDRFSWPETRPKYDRGIEDLWWFDAEKAARVANR